jgi:hypothetical protein
MRILTVILSVLLLASCDNGVRFETPQPEGQTNENSIPKKLIGEYFSLEDSSRLNITFGQITKTLISDLSLHKSALDSSDRLTFNKDSTFSQRDSKMKIDVIIKGDSVFEHVIYKDTIFDASKGDVLRKLKGYYFLNRQTTKSDWVVTKLTKTKKGLTLGSVTKKEDIDNLRELTETKSDTINSFRPTRKQFRRFIKTNGFNDQETFIKIK